VAWDNSSYYNRKYSTINETRRNYKPTRACVSLDTRQTPPPRVLWDLGTVNLLHASVGASWLRRQVWPTSTCFLVYIQLGEQAWSLRTQYVWISQRINISRKFQSKIINLTHACGASPVVCSLHCVVCSMDTRAWKATSQTENITLGSGLIHTSTPIFWRLNFHLQRHVRCAWQLHLTPDLGPVYHFLQGLKI